MKKYIEFHKKDIEGVLEKLSEKGIKDFLTRTINGQEYCAFSEKLIYAYKNLRHFEPFFL